MNKDLIIIIDFDKTIANTEYPIIHGLMPHAKEAINKWYGQGAYIIINTCRSSKAELECEMYLLNEGINFNKINNQHPIGLFEYGTDNQIDAKLDSRKIFGHINFDDTNAEWMINGHPGFEKMDQDVQTIIKMNPNRWNIKPDDTPIN